MKLTPPLCLSLTLLAMLWLPNAQASNRWDVLNWCTQRTTEDQARCEGYLQAAVDLRISDDFPGSRSCFQPQTRLPDVQKAVIIWLRENRVAPEKSGLALVARAIEEVFPCPD